MLELSIVSNDLFEEYNHYLHSFLHGSGKDTFTTLRLTIKLLIVFLKIEINYFYDFEKPFSNKCHQTESGESIINYITPGKSIEC